jgi:hypothetical protein
MIKVQILNCTRLSAKQPQCVHTQLQRSEGEESEFSHTYELMAHIRLRRVHWQAVMAHILSRMEVFKRKAGLHNSGVIDLSFNSQSGTR